MTYLTHEITYADYCYGNPYGREYAAQINGKDVPGARALGNEEPWIVVRVTRGNSSRTWVAWTYGWDLCRGRGYTRAEAIDVLLTHIAQHEGGDD